MSSIVTPGVAAYASDSACSSKKTLNVVRSSSASGRATDSRIVSAAGTVASAGLRGSKGSLPRKLRNTSKRLSCHVHATDGDTASWTRISTIACSSDCDFTPHDSTAAASSGAPLSRASPSSTSRDAASVQHALPSTENTSAIETLEAIQALASLRAAPRNTVPAGRIVTSPLRANTTRASRAGVPRSVTTRLAPASGTGSSRALWPASSTVEMTSAISTRSSASSWMRRWACACSSLPLVSKSGSANRSSSLSHSSTRLSQYPHTIVGRGGD